MKVPVPAKVGVKADPLDRLLIAKPTRRLDAREKVNGAAQFGIDVRQPEMRVAVVVRPRCSAQGQASDLDVTKLGVKGLQRALIVAVDRGGTGRRPRRRQLLAGQERARQAENRVGPARGLYASRSVRTVSATGTATWATGAT